MLRILFAFVLLGWIATANAQPASWTAPGPSSGTGYPSTAVPYTATATGTTSATVTVTPPTGKTVYVCGLSAAELGGTAQTATGTITNLLGPGGTAVTASWYFNGTAATGAALEYLEDLVPCAVAVTGQAVAVTTPTSTAATSSTLFVIGYFF